MLEPKEKPAQQKKGEALRSACRERVSLRGVEHIFGVCRQTVMRWLIEEAEQLPKIRDTLL